MQHILLQKAKRYTDPISVSISNRYTFDSKKGYWLDEDKIHPMMTGERPQIHNSKKWDRETGEDQKGE